MAFKTGQVITWPKWWLIHINLTRRQCVTYNLVTCHVMEIHRGSIKLSPLTQWKFRKTRGQEIKTFTPNMIIFINSSLKENINISFLSIIYHEYIISIQYVNTIFLSAEMFCLCEKWQKKKSPFIQILHRAEYQLSGRFSPKHYFLGHYFIPISLCQVLNYS